MSDEATKYNKYEVAALLNFSRDQEFKLERVFDVYKQSGGKFFYYNLLNTVRFPSNINKSAYMVYHVKENEPWTNISFKFYTRIDLWWLIAAINQIDDTFTPLPTGTKIMVPTPEAVRVIVDEIKTKI